MTISSEVTKVLYAGNGVTAIFDVPFYFLKNEDVKVIHRAANGVETPWTEGSEYTLVGEGLQSGGTVTVEEDFVPAAGTALLVKRELLLTQETDYPEGGQFPASAHENALDRAAMRDQQLLEQINRKIGFSETSTASATLPDPEAGYIIGWNDAATDLENKITPAGISTLATIATAIQEVASIAGDVTQAASDSTEINTVAGDTVAINALAAIATTLSALGAIVSDITQVASDSADIQTVAGDSAAVQALASVSSALGALESVVSEIGSLGSGSPLAGLSAIGAVGAVAYDKEVQIGRSSTGTLLNIEVGTYDTAIVARPYTTTGELAVATTAPVGAALIFDVLKNGTTIYTTKPEIAAGATTLTAGTLKSDGTQTFAVNDIRTIAVTQVGSTVPGQGVSFATLGNYV